MPSHKLATHETVEGPRAGIVVDDKMFDLAQATGYPGDASLVAFYANWQTAQARLAAALDKGPRTEGRPLSTVKLLAPLLYPGAIYCAGANYQDHAAEMAARQGAPPPTDPHTQGLKAWHFIKASRSVTRPDATVTLPRASGGAAASVVNLSLPPRHGDEDRVRLRSYAWCRPCSFSR